MKISLVSYLNSYPFHYGLQQAAEGSWDSLRIVPPAQCAIDFMEGCSDVALVPVGALPFIPSYEILEPYCIAADGVVKSVLLVSRVHLSAIREVTSDADSRSSNALVQWFFREQLNRPLTMLPSDVASDSRVVIGDKAFALAGEYPYVYDLAEEWKKGTGLPFVFAVWIYRPGLEASSLQKLNEALQHGISHKEEALQQLGTSGLTFEKALLYLNQNIVYTMDDDARKAIEKFMEFLLR